MSLKCLWGPSIYLGNSLKVLNDQLEDFFWKKIDYLLLISINDLINRNLKLIVHLLSRNTLESLGEPEEE